MWISINSKPIRPLLISKKLNRKFYEEQHQGTIHSLRLKIVKEMNTSWPFQVPIHEILNLN